MDYPEYVEKIIDRLESAGYPAYVVGGSLRDMMLGRAPYDFDIATAAPPDVILAIFSDMRTIPTGLKHGTVTVLDEDGCGVEVTTFRIDGEYADSRHPDSVLFTSDINKDLSRRDFTVNAMAYNKKRGLVDPFGGREDIKRRVLRAVGDPDKRMREDALRIMRALRFSAQLGFAIDGETQAALTRQKEGLRNVSEERLCVELSKLLMAQDPTSAIKKMRELGICRYLLGEYTPYDKCIETLEKLSCHLPTRLACLLYGCNESEANGILRKLKYSNAIREETLLLLEIKKYSEPRQDAEYRRFLLDFGKSSFAAAELGMALGAFEKTLALELERIRAEGYCDGIPSLALNGGDLIMLGMRGEEIGRTLKELLLLVTEDPSANTREYLMEYINNKAGNNTCSEE